MPVIGPKQRAPGGKGGMSLVATVLVPEPLLSTAKPVLMKMQQNDTTEVTKNLTYTHVNTTLTLLEARGTRNTGVSRIPPVTAPSASGVSKVV